MSGKAAKPMPTATKKVFRKLGTCSRTFCYLLDREFGHTQTAEETASDPLAGGIYLRGYQCGMLWGAALAIGAEALRRCPQPEQATGLAIQATRAVMQSFEQSEQTIDCRIITKTNFRNPFSMVKYLLSGKAFYCFNLAERWAPTAIRTAQQALEKGENPPPGRQLGCAGELLRKMGATNEECAMVAGFAGGLGLSGGGCGALAAAIWYHTLAWCREHPGKSAPIFSNKNAKRAISTFTAHTDGRYLCSTICGQTFATAAEHSKFIKQGGCADLLEALAQS